ncbi:MAG: hypothetical protein LBP52_00920, partial [Burkholderiaceae bacterium]|nr:hypothetical protein [Burkholderiaceae bacterium]
HQRIALQNLQRTVCPVALAVAPHTGAAVDCRAASGALPHRKQARDPRNVEEIRPLISPASRGKVARRLGAQGKPRGHVAMEPQTLAPESKKRRTHPRRH